MKSYGTEKGWLNKKRQNNKRSKGCVPGRGRKQSGEKATPKPEEEQREATPQEKSTGSSPENSGADGRPNDANVTPEATTTEPAVPEKKEGRGEPAKGDLDDKPSYVKLDLNAKPDLRFDPGMVAYLQMALGLIEGREFSYEEVLKFLNQTMRQRSFDGESLIDYILRNLKHDPP